MIIKVRTMFVAVPLAAALTAAAAVVFFGTPWTALPGVFGGMVTAATEPLAALGHRVTEPEGASVTAGAGVVLDTTAVVELPAPAESAAAVKPAGSGLSPHEPNDPIDYARLNTDVRVVTDTLERFNQKLLRMIAQAKSAHDRRPIAPAPPAVDAAASVALDAPVAAAADPDAPKTTGAELKQ